MFDSASDSQWNSCKMSRISRFCLCHARWISLKLLMTFDNRRKTLLLTNWTGQSTKSSQVKDNRDKSLHLSIFCWIVCVQICTSSQYWMTDSATMAMPSLLMNVCSWFAYRLQKGKLKWFRVFLQSFCSENLTLWWNYLCERCFIHIRKVIVGWFPWRIAFQRILIAEVRLKILRLWVTWANFRLFHTLPCG